MNGIKGNVKNKTRTTVVLLVVAALSAAAFPLWSPSTWADEVTTSGAHAVRNGQALEHLIETTLVSHGFTAVNYTEWRAQPNAYRADLLLKGVPFTTVYGSEGHTEFVLKSPRLDSDVRIEAKWQQSPGSIDEKLPYLYLNASRFDTMPEAHVIIVIDGAGWREGAVQWLRHAAENPPPGKRIDVFDLAQFLAWANTL